MNSSAISLIFRSIIFGHNSLSLISAWQKIYMNDPYKLISDRNITLTDEIKKQVIGGEVAMWGEQVRKKQIVYYCR